MCRDSTWSLRRVRLIILAHPRRCNRINSLRRNRPARPHYLVWRKPGELLLRPLGRVKQTLTIPRYDGSPALCVRAGGRLEQIIH